MSLPKPYYEDEEHGIVIYHADCRELLPLLPRVDLLLTDPPYGINITQMTLGNGRNPIYRGANHWDQCAPDIQIWVEHASHAVVWGGNYFCMPPSSRWFVWDKLTGDNDYADCELAWTNGAGVVKKYTQLWKGVNAREPHERRVHPTQKPLGLMKWCLGFFPKAETVLDPFMGSGTTLVACKQLGRRGIGIELDERYCEIAARRLSQWMLFGQDELAQIGGGK